MSLTLNLPASLILNSIMSITFAICLIIGSNANVFILERVKDTISDRRVQTLVDLLCQFYGNE